MVTPMNHFTAGAPVEMVETEYPMMVRRYDIWRDSAGPGHYRGGIGYVREFEMKEDCVLTLRASGHRSASWGLAGGGGPAISRTSINPGTASEAALSAIETRQLKAGDVLRLERSGGGGYGSPLERPVDVVRQDVVNGYVGVDAAWSRYGVRLDPRSLVVDEAATAARRTQNAKP
jgi:N-methylhydantoinase B